MNSWDFFQQKHTNMYDKIQEILTYLIEAIAIIGFCGCWFHYAMTRTLNEVASWGKPQILQQPMQEKALGTCKTREISEEFPILQNPWELDADTEIKNSSFSKPISPAKTEQPQNRKPTFQEYSKTRLRKIARELKIRRYSQMEIPELIMAITSHPEAQRISA